MTNLSSLEALSALCCSVKSFLGPEQRIKCILEGVAEENCLVSSCSELLCNLDIEHPVGRLAVDACLAHQKAHGMGTTTMMAMAGFWAAEIQSLLTQGVPTEVIIKYGNECLEQCLASLETIAEPCYHVDNNPGPKRTQSSSGLKAQTEAYEQSDEPSTGGSPSSCSTEKQLPTVHQPTENLDPQRCMYSENLLSCNHTESSGTVKVAQHPSTHINSESRAHSFVHSEHGHGSTPDVSQERFDSRKENSVFSDDDEEEDEFVEVQFNSQGPIQSLILNQAKPILDAALTSGTDTQCRSVPEIATADDDISWFFERESKTPEYSLEHHRSDFKALPKAFEGKHVEDECYSNLSSDNSAFNYKFSKGRTNNEIMNDTQVQDDSDGEFDSCFTEEQQDVSQELPVEKSGAGPTKDKTDNEFEPQESVFSRTSEENKRGDTCDVKLSDDEHIADLDSCCSAKELQDLEPTSQQKHFHSRVDVDKSKCNVNMTPQEISTENEIRKHGAILKSVQDLLLAKHNQSFSQKLAKAQNNSRHFRSIETAINQHKSGEQGSASSYSSSKADTKENSGFKSKKAASQRQDTVMNSGHYQRNSGTPRSLNFENVKVTETAQVPKREEIEKLLKGRKEKTAVRRLGSVQNNSRHFRTIESVTSHNVGNEDLTLGQEFDLEVNCATSEVSDKHLTTVGDGSQNKTWHLQNDRNLQLTNFTYEANIHSSTNGHVTQTPVGPREADIVRLGCGLSHGSELEMRLVVEAFQMQRNHLRQGESTLRGLDLNRINVCTVAGPPTSDSHLQTGLMIPVDHHQRLAIAEAEGKCLRGLLINGDASPTFRHAGYKNKLKVTRIEKWTGLPTTDDRSWLGDTMKLLQELDIKLIILKGRAEEQLLHHCLSKKVLLLQDVPYRILQALGEACHAPVLTYLNDATADDTTCGVTVALWESGWVDRTRGVFNGQQNKLFARICMDGQLLQTAVLCHTVASLLPASEARLWACAHRLHDAVEVCQYLPGAGLPEQTAIKHLQRFKESSLTSGNHGNSCYKNVIASAFAEGFLRFLVQVLLNMGKLEDTSTARTLIMNALHRDRLEPVLSSFTQSELPKENLCESVTSSEVLNPDSTAILSDHNLQEPDPSGNDRSDVVATESVDYIKCESSSLNSEFNIETTEAFSSSGVDSSSNPRADSANQHRENGHLENHPKLLLGINVGEVYDSYAAKKSAWENAWTLLKTVLRIDAHIVTGLQESGQTGSAVKMGRQLIL